MKLINILPLPNFDVFNELRCANIALLEKQIETSELKRKLKLETRTLKIENQHLRGLSSVGNEVLELIHQLVASQNKIEMHTENIHRIFENTGQTEPIQKKPAKKLTFKQHVKAEVIRRKAAETQSILKEVYQKIV